MSTIAVWLCRGVTWQVAEPLVPDGVTELGPPAPQVAHIFRMSGFGEFAIEMAQAKARRCVREVTCHLCWMLFTDASEALQQKVSLLSDKGMSEEICVSCPGQGGNA